MAPNASRTILRVDTRDGGCRTSSNFDGEWGHLRLQKIGSHLTIVLKELRGVFLQSNVNDPPTPRYEWVLACTDCDYAYQ